MLEFLRNTGKTGQASMHYIIKTNEYILVTIDTRKFLVTLTSTRSVVNRTLFKKQTFNNPNVHRVILFLIFNTNIITGNIHKRILTPVKCTCTKYFFFEFEAMTRAIRSAKLPD